jgi:hypothetical protein
MATTVTSRAGGALGYIPIVGILMGALIFVYGLLLVSVSPLGAVWIATAGLAMFLGALFATELSGRRLGLSTATRKTLSWTFTGIAAILLLSFLVINGMGFEANVASSTT